MVKSNLQYRRVLIIAFAAMIAYPLQPADCARIESLTRGIANKLLHRVVCGLRETQRGASDLICTAEIARDLLSAKLFGEESHSESIAIVREYGETDLCDSFQPCDRDIEPPESLITPTGALGHASPRTAPCSS